MTTPPSAPAAPAPLSRSRERQAIAALALAAFALNLNTNVLGALLPFLPGEWMRAGGGDDGPLLAAAAWASALAALVAGPLADRNGRRPLLVSGMAAFTLASLAHLLVDGYVSLLCVRALAGGAVGVAYAAASALVAEIVPYERRAAAMGVFTAGMFLAIPVGLPLAVWFAAAGHWSWIFGVQAVFAAAGVVLALRAVPELPRPRGLVAFGPVLRRAPVQAALVAVLLHVGSFFATVQLATRWLDESGLVPKGDQGVLWIVLGFASACGSFLFGRLADRVGKRAFVLATSVVLVFCFGFLPRVDSMSVLLPLGLVLAVTAAARTGPLQALTSGLVPADQLGTLMGLRAFAMQLGVAAFALGVTPFVDDLGFAVVFGAAALCQAGSYAAIRFGVREDRP